MRSLAYLILMSVKNRVLEVVRNPRKLTVYLLIIAAIPAIFILSLFTRGEAEDVGSFLDMIWLKGIFFLLVLLFFFISVSKGLKKGDTIFEMNDVNFLFVSPINPRTILLYGLGRMMGMAFLMGLFILFQGNSLGMTFGINFSHIFLIFLMLIIAAILLQMMSLLIYSLTNNSLKRKRLVRLISVMIFIPMFVYGVWQVATQSTHILVSLESLLHSPVVSWTPVVGWSASATFAFLTGEIVTGFLFVGVMVVFGGILMAIMMLSNPDYYEDVLVATESAFEKKRAKEEGLMSDESSFKRTKIITSPLKGSGASVLFYKHLRESFRSNPLGIWNYWSILLPVIIIAVAVIIRINDGGSGTLSILLQSAMWAQLFVVGMGRGILELSTHYIYMIPTSAFSKLVWNNCESILKVTVESSVMFGVSGIILGASPLLTLVTISAYIAFTLMLIGVWHLILRWTGLIANQGILVFVYMMIVLVLILPGLIPALIVGFREEMWSAAVGMAILTLWQTIAALGCFGLSKEILHKADIPSSKLWK